MAHTRREDPAAGRPAEAESPRGRDSALSARLRPRALWGGHGGEILPRWPEYVCRYAPALQSAEHSIYVESFIIGMGEMWGQIHEILRQKAAAGLDVRVIYDDAGCLSLLPHNYAEMMRADGIRAFSFNRCVLLNLVMNNRDHRKIMVIDGKIGFTGGVNLADEYINKLERFGYWKDSGVRLEGPGATALANIF